MFFKHFVRLTIKGGLQSRAACIFFFTLSKGQDQNLRQKVVNRGALRLCGGALRSCRWALHSNLTNIPLIHSVSYFNLGGLELCLGGLSPPKPPLVATELVKMTFSLSLPTSCRSNSLFSLSAPCAHSVAEVSTMNRRELKWRSIITRIAS